MADTSTNTLLEEQQRPLAEQQNSAASSNSDGANNGGAQQGAATGGTVPSENQVTENQPLRQNTSDVAEGEKAKNEEKPQKEKKRWTDWFWKGKQPGETDEEKRQRQEENQRRLGGYFDLLNSFIGLGYAMKGGRSMYSPENGFYQTTDKHQKDMEERRRKNEDSYFSRYIKDQELRRKENKDAMDAEIKRINQQLQQDKFQLEKDKFEIDKAVQEGKLDKTVAETQKINLQNQYYEREKEAQLQLYKLNAGLVSAKTENVGANTELTKKKTENVGANTELTKKKTELTKKKTELTKKKTELTKKKTENVGKGKGGSSSGGGEQRKIWSDGTETSAEGDDLDYNSLL